MRVVGAALINVTHPMEWHKKLTGSFRPWLQYFNGYKADILLATSHPVAGAGEYISRAAVNRRDDRVIRKEC